MERVGPLIGAPAVLLPHFSGRFLATLTALLFAAHRPLQPLQCLQTTLERLRVGDDGPIGACGQRLHAQVHPPTGPVFSSTACSCSTCTETYQCPACSETVPESPLPQVCQSWGATPAPSRRTRPSRGNRMAWVQTTSDPVRRKLPTPVFLVVRCG